MDADYKQARDKSQTFASIQYPSLYSELDTTISLKLTDTYHQIFNFPPQSPCIMDAGYK